MVTLGLYMIFSAFSSSFFLVSGWGTLPEATFATFGEGSALEPSDSHAFATFPLHCLVFRVLIRLQIHQNLILGLIYCLHQFCLFVWVQHGSTLHLACHAFVSVFTSAFHQHQRLKLVGGFNPSEKYESQLGWLFPIYGKYMESQKFMFQSTKQ